MKNRIYAYLLIMSALLIAGSLISYFSGNITLTSILLIPGFVALATGVSPEISTKNGLTSKFPF